MRFLTRFTTKLMERYLPDAFVFVILLTLVVFILSFATTGTSVLDVTYAFGSGFWGMMTFTLQMAMVLLLGSVMANSPVFKRLLKALAQAPKTAGGAIVMVSLIATIACWINWGFGLVLGALIAREVAKYRNDTDYRLLIASAYSGFLVWHGGIAGSVPLSIATDGHIYEAQIGIIPITETVFSTGNLIICLLLLIAIPLINYLMLPAREERVIIDPTLLSDPEPELKPEHPTPAERMEHSRLPNYLIGLLGAVYIVMYFGREGFNLNLNIINFIFFILAIVLHGTPRNLINAVDESARAVGPILVQFPFYAAIMAMMVSSGLAGNITNLFVNIASESNFYVLSFLSAGLVNFFVPSGGGQWAVQAPIMIEAVNAYGGALDQAKMAMSIAWGDAWTNMIQPFWALPALAIAGLKARDIMGFCVIHLLVSGLIISGVFYWIY